MGLLEGHNGEVVVQGEVDLSDRYIGPTVILNPDPSTPIGQQEIFGPILPVYTFTNIDEATRVVAEGEKPLVVYHFSTNKANTNKLIERTSSGHVSVNDCVFYLLNMDLPFGGCGPSGHGRYQSKFGFLNMTNPKTVMRKYSLNIWPLTCRYPPATPDKQAMFFRLFKLVTFNQGTMFRRLKQLIILLIFVILYKKGYFKWTKPIYQIMSALISAKYHKIMGSS
jgi:hypothetical protein